MNKALQMLATDQDMEVIEISSDTPFKSARESFEYGMGLESVSHDLKYPSTASQVYGELKSLKTSKIVNDKDTKIVESSGLTQGQLRNLLKKLKKNKNDAIQNVLLVSASPMEIHPLVKPKLFSLGESYVSPFHCFSLLEAWQQRQLEEKIVFCETKPFSKDVWLI